MTNPTPLSPAAQAVLDAYKDARDGQYVNGEWIQDEAGQVAAALHAAADQVVPREPHPGESQFWDDDANREWQNNQSIRKQLLAIADELEGSIHCGAES